MILLLAACSSTSDVPDAPPLASVRYAFEWAAPEGMQRTADHLTFTTDTGVTITLTEANLVTYSAWLRPCPKRQGAWLPSWSGVAYAGHSALSNPTASRPAFVEDLLQPSRTVLGPIAVEEPVWCGVEALVARADANTTGVSDLTKDTSLRMVGTWTDPAGAVTPFTWTSTLHHSATGPLEWRGSGPHGEVTVTRTLEGLFDGIDFASTPPPRILRGALANLMDTTTFRAMRSADAAR